jgi:hypothetical protein
LIHIQVSHLVDLISKDNLNIFKDRELCVFNIIDAVNITSTSPVIDIKGIPSVEQTTNI